MLVSEIKYDYSTWIKLLSGEIIIQHDDLFFDVKLGYIRPRVLGFRAQIRLKQDFILKNRLNFMSVFMANSLKFDLKDYNLSNYYPTLELIFKNETVTQSLNESLEDLLDTLSNEFKEKIKEEIKDFNLSWKEILSDCYLKFEEEKWVI